ncbi:hypothetical protein [Leuconostoc gasicomitatum]|uniref:hypothetical protein n=1 Tax=Leuconostoc gasicomitatum TaxID=115778 RepID=UPI001CC70DB3|nr:hypothetical protein [Leuconostoc gasicomitatum]MBZ5949252.1 hypothetical protein [Leuconostoc gasicomitatum]
MIEKPHYWVMTFNDRYVSKLEVLPNKFNVEVSSNINDSKLMTRDEAEGQIVDFQINNNKFFGHKIGIRVSAIDLDSDSNDEIGINDFVGHFNFFIDKNSKDMLGEHSSIDSSNRYLNVSLSKVARELNLTEKSIIKLVDSRPDLKIDNSGSEPKIRKI